MKKIFSIMLALALLCGMALAVELVPAAQGDVFALNERTPVDLDGDGAMEEVLLQMEGIEEEQYLALYVFGSDGAVYNYEMYVSMLVSAFAHDLDGDGNRELFICCDFYSDDYLTYCMGYDMDDGLSLIQFADAAREASDTPYTDSGYGLITAIDGNQITMTGSQDVLGTWFASRVFALEDGRFELADDGLWRMMDITGDPDTWEYSCLELMQDLPVTLEDGGEGMLKVGEKFVVTRSDRESEVYFITRDGVKGSFAIEPDMERGWGSLIHGASEDEWFEYVPYAD